MKCMKTIITLFQNIKYFFIWEMSTSIIMQCRCFLDLALSWELKMYATNMSIMGKLY